MYKLRSRIFQIPLWETLQVRVTDLMGGSLGKMTVTADSAKNLGDQSVVVSKKQFSATSEEYVSG